MSAGDLNVIVEQEEEEALRGDDDSMGDEIMIEDIEAPSSILIPPRSLSSSDISVIFTRLRFTICTIDTYHTILR